MDYLITGEKLVLKHEPGNGAWTYHIQIPNTKHIVGKWGSLKVSGTIDNYKIDSINLFTKKGQDKLIAVNEKIRMAINKSGGDIVTVTLYWLTSKEKILENDILDTFKEAGVLHAFEKLPEKEKSAMITRISALPSEEKQVDMILKCIDQLS
jgi:hypothetical protein